MPWLLPLPGQTNEAPSRKYKWPAAESVVSLGGVHRRERRSNRRRWRHRSDRICSMAARRLRRAVALRCTSDSHGASARDSALVTRATDDGAARSSVSNRLDTHVGSTQPALGVDITLPAEGLRSLRRPILRIPARPTGHGAQLTGCRSRRTASLGSATTAPYSLDIEQRSVPELRLEAVVRDVSGRTAKVGFWGSRDSEPQVPGLNHYQPYGRHGRCRPVDAWSAYPSRQDCIVRRRMPRFELVNQELRRFAIVPITTAK